MFIEVYLQSEVLTRLEIPDDLLKDDPALSWHANARMRENVVKYHLQELKQKIKETIKGRKKVHFCLVFESKINLSNEHE